MNQTNPALNPETAVCVGRVVAPHGLHGEVKVESLTDFPQRFDRGAQVWLDGSPVTIERARWEKNIVCLKLEGVSDRDAAEALRGKELMLPEAAELDDEDGVYYLHDILGVEVVDETGRELGRLADVLTTGSNDVYVVRGERGELLLPAIEDVIKDVDITARRMTVTMLPGLEFQVSAWQRGQKPAAGKTKGTSKQAKASQQEQPSADEESPADEA